VNGYIYASTAKKIAKIARQKHRKNKIDEVRYEYQYANLGTIEYNLGQVHFQLLYLGLSIISSHIEMMLPYIFGL